MPYSQDINTHTVQCTEAALWAQIWRTGRKLQIYGWG